ncbi:hypothetical protein SAMN05892883_1853 [Jatrophihabitans sp. GAS493]|uniref:hypothetical protein n=1 Tax=Jatrophihabitans sp. GAS493 TaxID=1907575 RepID=UPI000BBFE69A|nr:hypothetical protein [Jatrophihabitans sp. GAS493]SOD72462.1 hypothetical protein SAMN05892883_1853 [Jatrophihabitans sp. GAS493]
MPTMGSPAGKTTFDLHRHGFHFDNSFDSILWDAIAVGPIRIPRVTFGGLCGGMGFAALDNFHADRPAPPQRGEDFPGAGVPAVGSGLHELIYRRHLASVGLSPAAIGVPMPGGRARVLPIHPENLLRYPFLRAAPERVRRHETRTSLRSLQGWLEEGYPMPLGLVSDEALTASHQVVAYDFTPGVHASLIQVYDCRYPDRPAQLIVAEDGSSCVLSVEGEPSQAWRAFFIPHYDPVPAADGAAWVGEENLQRADEDAS